MKYIPRVAFAVALLFAPLHAAAAVPRPEHPRPDAYRENWMTLNGEWQFEIDRKGDGEARGLMTGRDLGAKIIVPFCPESKLSGLGLGNTEYFTHAWYRRSFELPAAMKSQRVRLHFGGVDYQASVFLNGQLAGTHTGGSAAFAFDITALLRDGPNEVVVQVFDDLRSGRQPGGKQAHKQSEGCVYTRTTGIWQPVWLEAVGSSFVEKISVVPDPDQARVLVEATIDGDEPGLTLAAEAFADGSSVGSESSAGPGRTRRLVVKLSQKKLWAPGTPFLYDLKLTLTRGAEKVDELKSYFGLRKVTVDGRRILINDQPVFQRLILDQGFYPDGIWTAPTDDALKLDIELSMAAGYNGARLHQKVFEPRFLYWADKLGYLVWGEFPSWGYNLKPDGYAPYVSEWTEILLRDRNHPSIIGWCPFNETPPAAGEIQQLTWNVTKAVDPTRPVLESSGYAHTLAHPEVRDAHDYDGNPASLRQRWADYFGSSGSSLPARYGQSKSSGGKDCGVPFMVSEFGGIGWATAGGWGYGQGPKTLDEFYARYQGQVDALLDNPNMFGFCYTQLTDVEQEHNGLYYYDRRPKFDVKKVQAITARSAAYERGEPAAPQPGAKAAPRHWKVLVGAAQDGDLGRPYRYATNAPAATWTDEGFDDAAWPSGLAPFGTIEHPRTSWKTSDLWLRSTFTWDGDAIHDAALVVFYDEDTEIFVNGQRIWNRSGYVTSYEMFNVGAALKKALRKGANTLAVHTHQSAGGQYIDLALLVE